MKQDSSYLVIRPTLYLGTSNSSEHEQDPSGAGTSEAIDQGLKNIKDVDSEGFQGAQVFSTDNKSVLYAKRVCW